MVAAMERFFGRGADRLQSTDLKYALIAAPE